jgi:hypothetical protein
MNKTNPELLQFKTRSEECQMARTDPMNGRAVADRTFPPNGPIGICDSAEGLYAIKDSGKELIICQRLIPFDMSEWLKNIAPSQLPDFRILVRPVDVREAIRTQLDECGMPSGSGRDLFIGDIAKLVSIYAQITRRGLVDVRLDRIENDACRKFHKDSVETRLLTTYIGPTTQWINPQYAEQALREQKAYGGPLGSLREHDVAIFRGRHANLADGIVHRSPPIEGTRSVRLLLCLNVLSIVSPEAWRRTLPPIRDF